MRQRISNDEKIKHKELLFKDLSYVYKSLKSPETKKR